MPNQKDIAVAMEKQRGEQLRRIGAKVRRGLSIDKPFPKCAKHPRARIESDDTLQTWTCPACVTEFFRAMDKHAGRNPELRNLVLQIRGANSRKPKKREKPPCS